MIGFLQLEEDGMPSKGDLVMLLSDDGYTILHAGVLADKHLLVDIGCLKKGRVIEKKRMKFT